jgi:hypothetical protein
MLLAAWVDDESMGADSQAAGGWQESKKLIEEFDPGSA